MLDSGVFSLFRHDAHILRGSICHGPTLEFLESGLACGKIFLEEPEEGNIQRKKV